MAIALILLFFSMPTLHDGRSNIDRIRGLDGIGGLLSILWPVPVLYALQEAGGHFAWNSGVIIGTLIAGVILLVCFVMYETWVTYRSERDPIFPMSFIRNPCMALVLL